ncbi:MULTISPECIES: Lrp/AsnC family transcriptional regulator [Pyrobaculum]|uniref:Transcriptional regulator, AsnC family n=2 Tax=Pyrobaculum arsenaticum TaxID=121277 RepID=A4WLY7_PYRAR|nr:Lrp/AsnC family transcriptional regulator [Pyrobaculum arsenaticum]ABP51404.1 transcriptional regulator, AsnC family [Pyrobaculum arsenaticum DSM 13514]MCY0889950.1 Lrp/AsnC family transcriptional regulator [Pyrobaculum arsenaticum]NYR16226.1 Lrp/AsnC family transcriptional regulator [Pyrobaculum arsenaticum]
MDEIDRKLIMALQEDGKKTLQELSELVGRPKTTIATRIKKLEIDGVIIGYKAVVNPFALGYRLLSFVLVSVRRGTAPRESKPLQVEVAEKVLTECKGEGGLPYVEEAYVVTGPYDLLFKVWSRDVKQLSNFLVAYLASDPNIQRTETMIVLEIVDDWRRRVMPPATPG